MSSTERRPRLLLTGATGFLGRYLGREIDRRGLDLAVLARSAKRASWYQERGIPVFEGDVTCVADCRKALEGRDILVHLAAAADVSAPDVNRQVNVEGLRNVLRAGRESGMKRIVFVSSTCAGRRHRDAYGETKLEGETLVKESGLDYTILRPTMIYGRGSKEFEIFVNTVRWSPVVPLIGSGRNVIQPVHVDDAVGVILGVADSPAARGQTYDVAGATPISFDAFVRLVQRTLRLGPRLILHLPVAPMLAATRVLGRLATHVPLTVDQVMAFIQDTEVDLQPLARDLGFTPRTLEQGLPQVLQEA
jgi:nucleoside-diphosphate-sugar epimerase